MLLYHLCIERFRGVQTLDWHVGGRIVCLVGPGDSTKTAVLDAIELVLFPRPFFQFTDADFFNGDLSNPLRIEATVGDLPSDLIKEDKFGLWKRGYEDRLKTNHLLAVGKFSLFV
jgi:predicted ATP-dependent endonuclease of OLD family